jgi:hypothetical protein
MQNDSEVKKKVCRECKANKLLDEFWNLSNSADGKRALCIECMSKQHNEYVAQKMAEDPSFNGKRIKKWRDDHPDNSKKRSLWNKYRLRIHEYDAILEAQQWKCAICDELLLDDCDVDHNHKTGKVRGIIHHGCNMAIGILKDSPYLCRKAAEYLEKHGKV